MPDPGIVAVATYVPGGRLAAAAARVAGAGIPPGVRTVAVPDVDEDVVTMAVEVADRAIHIAGLTTGDIDGLTFATCSSPYVEHVASTEIGRALGIRRDAQLRDVAGDTRAAVVALGAAADAVELGRQRHHLVVAADRRRGRTGTPTELLGSAAAAAVVGHGGAALGDRRYYRHGVPTRWRPDGSPEVRSYDDPRYVRDEQLVPAIRAVVDGAEVFLALGVGDARSARAIARAVGCADADLGDDDVADIGDAGCAAPLFALARCLDRVPAGPGRVVAAAPGAGAASLEVAPAVVATSHVRPAERAVDYVTYLRAHGLLLPPAPPEPIVPWAATPGAARDDLAGARSAASCRACGALTIPARCRCVECHGSDLDLTVIPAVGRVVTHNLQHVVAVHPEAGPVAVGVARFAGLPGSRGGQVSAMFVDERLDELRVGAPAELVYRRLGCDDGLVKYGWKLRLLEDDGER